MNEYLLLRILKTRYQFETDLINQFCQPPSIQHEKKNLQPKVLPLQKFQIQDQLRTNNYLGNMSRKVYVDNAN